MRKVKVNIVSAFVENNKGGNLAGVVLNADNLSTIEKLEIANKVGLSETAFVSKSAIANFKLEFFTPNKQIAHCGHATIAAFSYLKQLNLLNTELSFKETIDGIRKIKLQGEQAFMEQLAPRYINVSQKQEQILKSLGIKASDLIPNAPIQLINTGNSFIIIPVNSIQVLKDINPDYELINQISEEFDLIGYYLFTQDLKNPDRDATTRMFGPRYGILEEAGTGMAAGPLACYFHDILNIQKSRFLIQQGKFMKEPSPSLIIVDLILENNRIKSIMAGGKGMLKTQIEIEVSN